MLMWSLFGFVVATPSNSPVAGNYTHCHTNYTHCHTPSLTSNNKQLCCSVGKGHRGEGLGAKHVTETAERPVHSSTFANQFVQGLVYTLVSSSPSFVFSSLPSRPDFKFREAWTSSITSPRDHHSPPLTSATAFFYACANSRTKFAA